MLQAAGGRSLTPLRSYPPSPLHHNGQSHHHQHQQQQQGAYHQFHPLQSSHVPANYLPPPPVGSGSFELYCRAASSSLAHSFQQAANPDPKSRWYAIYDYHAQGEDELGLCKGDVIEVLSKDYKISGDEGWWTGKCNGKVRAMMALIIDAIKAGNSHGTLSDYFSNYIIRIIHSPLAKVGVFPCNFVAPCDLDFSDLPKVVEDSN